MRFRIITIIMVVLFMFVFPGVVHSGHAVTQLFSWSISNATHGENSNCTNYWFQVGSTTPPTHTVINDGIVKTDGTWTGATITKVILYLMYAPSSTPLVDVTVGTFHTSDGSLDSVLGTISHTNIPVCAGGVPSQFTVTGSIVLQANEYVGIQYNDSHSNSITHPPWLQDYFDYNSPSSSLPAVTEWLGYSAGGSPSVVNNGNHTPFFGEIDGSLASCGSNASLGNNINCQLVLGAIMFSPTMIAFFGMMTVVMIAGVVNVGKQGMRVTDYMKQNAPFLIFMGIIFLIWASVAKVIP